MNTVVTSPAIEPKSMQSSWLKCLGVGDGWPRADRNHAAFVYRFANTNLLIDCGEAVSRSLCRFALDGNVIDHVFISHLHSDHVAGLFMLLQGVWLRRRKKELTIHLPAEGIEPIRQMLRATYLFEECFACRVRFHALRAGAPVLCHNVTVTPFLTSHLASTRARFGRKYSNAFEAFCFVIKTADQRVVHSADLGAARDLAPLFEQPTDLLVCELAHLAPTALFRFLRGRLIKRLVLVHLSGRHCGKVAALRRTAARTLPGISISIPRDAQEIVF